MSTVKDSLLSRILTIAHTIPLDHHISPVSMSCSICFSVIVYSLPKPYNESSLYEPLSKLLVSPLITPIILPYIVPYITPFKEFRL